MRQRAARALEVLGGERRRLGPAAVVERDVRLPAAQVDVPGEQVVLVAERAAGLELRHRRLVVADVVRAGHEVAVDDRRVVAPAARRARAPGCAAASRGPRPTRGPARPSRRCRSPRRAPPSRPGAPPDRSPCSPHSRVPGEVGLHHGPRRAPAVGQRELPPGRQGLEDLDRRCSASSSTRAPSPWYQANSREPAVRVALPQPVPGRDVDLERERLGVDGLLDHAAQEALLGSPFEQRRARRRLEAARVLAARRRSGRRPRGGRRAAPRAPPPPGSARARRRRRRPPRRDARAARARRARPARPAPPDAVRRAGRAGARPRSSRARSRGGRRPRRARRAASRTPGTPRAPAARPARSAPAARSPRAAGRRPRPRAAAARERAGAPRGRARRRARCRACSRRRARAPRSRRTGCRRCERASAGAVDAVRRRQPRHGARATAAATVIRWRRSAGRARRAADDRAQLVVAVGRDHQRRHPRHPPAEQLHDIERRLVGPVQILEDDDRRAAQSRAPTPRARRSRRRRARSAPPARRRLGGDVQQRTERPRREQRLAPTGQHRDRSLPLAEGRTSAVLPTPASPASNTICPRPPATPPPAGCRASQDGPRAPAAPRRQRYADSRLRINPSRRSSVIVRLRRARGFRARWQAARRGRRRRPMALPLRAGARPRPARRACRRAARSGRCAGR